MTIFISIPSVRNKYSIGIQMHVPVSLEEPVPIHRVDHVRLVAWALEYGVHRSARGIGHDPEHNVVLSRQARHVDEAVPIGIGHLGPKGIPRRQRHAHVIEWLARQPVDDTRVQWRRQRNSLCLTAGDERRAEAGKCVSQATVSTFRPG